LWPQKKNAGTTITINWKGEKKIHVTIFAGEGRVCIFLRGGGECKILPPMKERGVKRIVVREKGEVTLFMGKGKGPQWPSKGGLIHDLQGGKKKRIKDNLGFWRKKKRGLDMQSSVMKGRRGKVFAQSNKKRGRKTPEMAFRNCWKKPAVCGKGGREKI